MIEAAAEGSQREREAFARQYLSVVRSYLTARWGDSVLRQSIDDAVQEVFVECFRHDGPLARADRAREGGFRPFLFGLVRNVARRFENREVARRKAKQSRVDLNAVVCDETHLSHVFDRAWARTIMRQAADLQAERAKNAGDEAMRRVELLRMRFREGLPIREIARLWNEDASKLHHEYAKARQEFRAALTDVVAFHHAGSQEIVRQECANLLEMVR
jgi:RNA polymerase sigma-70 factor (ECF subfamily)